MRWVNRYSLLSGILVWLAAALAVAWGQDNNSKSKTQDNADERVESRPAAVPSLEALTKLRRSQKKPDPVTIEVELPKNSHATTRDLPKFRVALKNVDVEKLAVKFKYDGDYRSGRLARWRFEVRDSRPASPHLT